MVNRFPRLRSKRSPYVYTEPSVSTSKTEAQPIEGHTPRPAFGMEIRMNDKEEIAVEWLDFHGVIVREPGSRKSAIRFEYFPGAQSSPAAANWKSRHPCRCFACLRYFAPGRRKINDLVSSDRAASPSVNSPNSRVIASCSSVDRLLRSPRNAARTLSIDAKSLVEIHV